MRVNSSVIHSAAEKEDKVDRPVEKKVCLYDADKSHFSFHPSQVKTFQSSSNQDQGSFPLSIDMMGRFPFLSVIHC